MNILYLGDEQFRPIQEQHIETLSRRGLEPTVHFWSPSDLRIFETLDKHPNDDPLIIVGSRLGAIPAVHWTARNPNRVRRQILLHPSLHLNMPGQVAPQPHFVPTLIIHHSKEGQPNLEEVTPLAAKMFHDYALHLTPEPAELKSTLSLISLT